MKLNPEDKERIRAEEIFREEVRCENQATAQKGQSWCKRARGWVWIHLNSQVGGWLLSTVLVGSVVFFYNWCAQHFEDNARRQTLLVEIDFRVAGAMEMVREGKNTSVRSRLNEGKIYPDLQQRQMVSLLWELRSFYGSEGVKDELEAHVDKFVEYGNKPGKGFAVQVKALRDTIDKLSE